MTSQANAVREYLARLPADRQTAISTVREVILKHLPQGYEEGMQYGMIGYCAPHRLFSRRISSRSETTFAVRRARLAEEPHGHLFDV